VALEAAVAPAGKKLGPSTVLHETGHGNLGAEVARRADARFAAELAPIAATATSLEVRALADREIARAERLYSLVSEQIYDIALRGARREYEPEGRLHTMVKNEALSDALSNEVLSNTSAIVQRAEDALVLMDMFARHEVSDKELDAVALEVASFYGTGSNTLTGLGAISDNAVVLVREIEQLNMDAGNGSRLLSAVNQELDRRLAQREDEITADLEVWEERDQAARARGDLVHVPTPTDWMPRQ